MTGSIGMNVPGLDKVGGTVRGRTDGAKTTAKAVRDGIDTAGGLLGHGGLKSAAKTYVDNFLTDHANKLPTLIEGAGETTSNTARTGQSADEEGARDVKTATDKQTTLKRNINGPQEA